MARILVSGRQIACKATLLSVVWLACCWWTSPLAMAQCPTSGNADSLVTLARTLQAQGGEHQLEAIAHLHCALTLAALDKEASDPFFSQAHFALGSYYAQIGYQREALAAYHDCANALQAKDTLDEGEFQRLTNVLQRIATQYQRLSKPAKGKVYLYSAIQFGAQHYGENDTNTLEIVANASDQLVASGDLRFADSLAHRAWRIAQSYKKPVPSASARALLCLSDYHLAQGQADSANYYVEQALPYFPKLTPSGQVKMLLTHAAALLKLGRADAGVDEFRKAISLQSDSIATTTPRALGVLYVQFAIALQAAGKHREALEYLQNALIKFVPQFSNRLARYNPGHELWHREYWLLEVYHQKANCFEALGDADLALACHQEAFAYLDHLHRGSATPEERKRMTAIANAGYPRAIGIAYAIYASTQEERYLRWIFQFMEQGKTNAILESLHSIEQSGAMWLDPQLLQRWRYCKAEMDRLGDFPAVHSAEITELMAQQADMRKSLEQKYSGLAKLATGRITTTQAVQVGMHKDELLLSYFKADSLLFIFAIDKAHYACFATPIGADFDLAITKLTRSLALHPGPDPAKNWDRFAPAARYLFAKMVGPVFDGGFAKKMPKALTVIPDMHMPFLPLECLLTKASAPNEEPFVVAPYLARFCSLRYGQSATSLLAHGKPNFEQRLQGVLALAPEPEGAQASDYREREAREAVSVIDESDLLRDNKANQKALWGNASDYRLLHLACQVHADGNDPLQTWLALEKRDRSPDSLFAYKILDLNLRNTELVVLPSSGATAGELQPSDAVMDLARPFQAAGSPTSVMSLWNLDDPATEEILSNFYKYLAKGKSAALAMQLARNDFFASSMVAKSPEKAHPYFWAHMVTIGADGPHLPQYQVDWSFWLFWGGLLAIIIALLQRRARRKRALARKRRG